MSLMKMLLRTLPLLAAKAAPWPLRHLQSVTEPCVPCCSYSCCSHTTFLAEERTTPSPHPVPLFIFSVPKLLCLSLRIQHSLVQTATQLLALVSLHYGLKLCWASIILNNTHPFHFSLSLHHPLVPPFIKLFIAPSAEKQDDADQPRK